MSGDGKIIRQSLELMGNYGNTREIALAALDRLEAENARLRGLVKDAAEWIEDWRDADYPNVMGFRNRRSQLTALHARLTEAKPEAPNSPVIPDSSPEAPAPATECAKLEDWMGAHDASNLRLYARLFEEHKWQDPVIHWGVFHQTLNEVAGRIERLRADLAAANAEGVRLQRELWECRQLLAAAKERAEKAEGARKHTQDWYGSRWQRMHEYFRSPEMKDTKAANDWFSIVANGGLLQGEPPVCFMAKVNATRYRLQEAERQRDDARKEWGEAVEALRAFAPKVHPGLGDDVLVRLKMDSGGVLATVKIWRLRQNADIVARFDAQGGGK